MIDTELKHRIMSTVAQMLDRALVCEMHWERSRFPSIQHGRIRHVLTGEEVLTLRIARD